MAGLVEEKVKKYLDKIKKENGKIKAFLSLNENVLEEAKAIDGKQSKGRLYGYVFGIKSNICVRGLETNCASKTLEGWKATYDSTAVQKIKTEDGVIIGMTNMDEFASGTSGETSAFGACANPNAPGKIPGGSSSGSAAAVAAGFCDVALGSDTGGSIRNPASNCGVIGVKPSYGLASRYGLIDLSMSLDQIGPLGNNVADCALVLDIIKGKDEKDATSIESEKIEIKKIGRIKVGVLRVKGVDSRINNLMDETFGLAGYKKAEGMKKSALKDWVFKEIEIKHVDLAVQTYYPMVYSEFFSGTRRFDGRRYGKKIEEVCGPEVLRRILGGSEITKAEFSGDYYKKALEVKELIKEEFESIFKEVDCIIMPTVPSLPWKIGEVKKMKLEEIYAFDALTIPANLAEVCAISVPIGKIEDDRDGILTPVGIQIICAKGEESKMFSIAAEVEKLK